MLFAGVAGEEIDYLANRLGALQRAIQAASKIDSPDATVWLKQL